MNYKGYLFVTVHKILGRYVLVILFGIMILSGIYVRFMQISTKE